MARQKSIFCARPRQHVAVLQQIVLFLFALCCTVTAHAAPFLAQNSSENFARARLPVSWQCLEDGLELAELPLVLQAERSNVEPHLRGNALITAQKTARVALADNGERIVLLRINPQFFRCELLSVSDAASYHTSRTLEEWAEDFDLQAVINASMFLPGGVQSTGYLRSAFWQNNVRINKQFGSMLVFHPVHAATGCAQYKTAPHLPPLAKERVRHVPDPFSPRAPSVNNSAPPIALPEFQMLDMRHDDWKNIVPLYCCAVQNFRMLSAYGNALWPHDGEENSIAAIGEDAAHNLLFIHCRRHVSVRALTEILLMYDIALGRTMYVEGGVQAGLHVNSKGRIETWHGVSLSSFLHPSSSLVLPNVIGIKRR